ncbi:MAG: RHS repeat-associated core domain-containing protein [Haloplanus sp.]
MNPITSTLESQDQATTATLDLPGTGLTLEYDSRQVFGNVRDRRLEFPITDDSVPSALQRIDVEIEVAGQRHTATYDNPTPNLEHAFVWNGRDRLGRPVRGAEEVNVRVRYTYEEQYSSAGTATASISPGSSLSAPGILPSADGDDEMLEDVDVDGSGDRLVADTDTDADGGTDPLQQSGSGGDDDRSFGQRVRAAFESGESVSVRTSSKSVSRSWEGTLEAHRGRANGFGGWTASAQRTPEWAETRTSSGSGWLRTLAEKDRLTGVILDSPDDPPITGIPRTTFMRAGPDGTLYLANQYRIWALDPDGTFRTLAGEPEMSGYSGDGGPATEAKITIDSIAVGPAGRIYMHQVAGGAQGIIRRIDTDGVIDTVAGVVGEVQLTPNDELGEATATPLARVQDLAVGPEGDLYIAEYESTIRSDDNKVGGAVRRLTPDGRLVPVAGGKQVNVFFGPPLRREIVDDGPALDSFMRPTHIEVDSEGTVYTVEATDDGDGHFVRATDPDGRIRVVAGAVNDVFNSYDSTEEGGSAGEATFGKIVDSALGPKGTLYLSDEHQHRVRAIRPNGRMKHILGNGEAVPSDRSAPVDDDRQATDVAVPVDPIAVRPDGLFLFRDLNYEEPSQTVGQIYTREPKRGRGPIRAVRDTSNRGRIPSVAPSPDGRTAHEFSNGRHVRTADALLNTTRWEVERDGQGKVSAFVDAADNRALVERDGNGHLSAIEAPDGRRTTFTTDGNGYLSSAALPDGRQVTFDHTDDGLLTRLTDPKDNVTQYAYDAQGRATGRTGPRGNTTTLVRTDLDDGVEVKEITPEMRETTYRAERVNGNRKFVRTCCNGAKRETVLTSSGERRVSFADGRSRTVEWGPDPRYGLAAPVAEREVDESPGGRTSTTATERSATLTDLTDPLSLSSFTETITVNGRAFELTYDGGDRLRTTTPEGRSVEAVFNGRGRPTELTVDGTDPVSFARSGDGRLTELTQAGATAGFEHGGGVTTAATDPEGNRVEFGYNGGVRPTELVMPMGTKHSLSYDDNGNLVAFTRPNGDVHAFSYDAADNLTGYSPPEGGTTDISYDKDGLETELVRLSGRTLARTYDSGGRVRETTYPEATVSRTRDDVGRLTELVRSPSGGGTDQTLSLTRDGRAITDRSFGGAVSGTFQYAHDANGFVTEITDPDGTAHSIGHDDDGLATQLGPFSIVRDGPGGRPTEITDTDPDGTLTISLSYDDRGRVQTRTHTVDTGSGNVTIYDATYAYNAANQITERTETVDGTTVTERFAYDPNGRLIEVTRSGTVFETYAYDGNGNRTSRSVGASTVSASYRAGDRLAALGPTGYGYDADGFVTDRGGDSFTYSTVGELLDATPQGGTTITYDYDGRGRVVARTDDAGTTEYLYGDPANPQLVSVARAPDGTRTRYHYDPLGRVIALDRGGDRYYVATDNVGSPRIVTAADGSPVRRIDRDSYGVVRADTAPDFPLHVGFAGGIPDPATGLIRFGQRDYDPAAGRWTARDPRLLTGGQLNFYAYARNDPINFVDSTGLACHTWYSEFRSNYNQTTATPIDEVLTGGAGAVAGGVRSAAASTLLGKGMGAALPGDSVPASIATGVATGAVAGAVVEGVAVGGAGWATVAAVGGAAVTGGALAAAALGGIAIGAAISASL